MSNNFSNFESVLGYSGTIKNKRSTINQIESNKADEEKIKLENSHLLKINSKLKFNLDSNEIITMEGIRGHVNYISLKPITIPCLFELNIVDLYSKFNPIKFFEENSTDDYSKEYYKMLLKKGSYFPNVRFGILHEKGNKFVSAGSDISSFAFRVTDGILINNGEIKGYNDCMRESEILGIKCEYKIKSDDNNLSLKEINSTKNKSKSNINFNVCENNKIEVKYYINGKIQDNGFVDIENGKYHLIITIYNFAEVQLNTNTCKMKYKYDD